MTDHSDVDEDDIDDVEDETEVDDEVDVDSTIVAAKVVALAQKYLAEADYAGWLAKREQLAYEQEKIDHEFQMDGVYSFHAKVTQKSADKLLHAMAFWHRRDSQQPWTIYLNSVGGSVYAGNGIVDELIAHSLRGGGTHEITIKVRGVALSMGSLILQAADHRLIGRNSMLMIHKGSAGITGNADEIADMAEWFRRDALWMAQYFLDRTDKITRRQFLAKIDRRDWWLNSAEALELGLVDRIG